MGSKLVSFESGSHKIGFGSFEAGGTVSCSGGAAAVPEGAEPDSTGLEALGAGSAGEMAVPEDKPLTLTAGAADTGHRRRREVMQKARDIMACFSVVEQTQLLYCEYFVHRPEADKIRHSHSIIIVQVRRG
jgi:hypothetical protein